MTDQPPARDERQCTPEQCREDCGNSTERMGGCRYPKPLPSRSERRAYSVASINPFWRWAVALDHRPDLPAMPYWSRASAEAFADEYEAAFPERRATILRRRFWRRVDVV